MPDVTWVSVESVRDAIRKFSFIKKTVMEKLADPIYMGRDGSESARFAAVASESILSSALKLEKYFAKQEALLSGIFDLIADPAAGLSTEAQHGGGFQRVAILQPPRTARAAWQHRNHQPS